MLSLDNYFELNTTVMLLENKTWTKCCWEIKIEQCCRKRSSERIARGNCRTVFLGNLIWGKHDLKKLKLQMKRCSGETRDKMEEFEARFWSLEIPIFLKCWVLSLIRNEQKKKKIKKLGKTLANTNWKGGFLLNIKFS